MPFGLPWPRRSPALRIILAPLSRVASAAEVPKVDAPKLIEKVAFDWNHSGNQTIFSLWSRQSTENDGTADLLVIQRKQGKAWTLLNHDDTWGESEIPLPVAVRNQNLIQSKRLLFVKASSQPDARIFLILKGKDSGCCVGSMTVLTSSRDGAPHAVFHSQEHLLEAITPIDRDGILLIGQPSDSEAWATKNAQSYDPYRIYRLEGDKPARYDLQLSKQYTSAHYRQWHGPISNEHFAAIGRTTGAAHCWVTTPSGFLRYSQLHPNFFGR